MEFPRDVILSEGEKLNFSTPLVEIEVEFKSGRLQYVRAPLGNETDPTEKFLLFDRAQLQLSLLPVYPERPVIFKPEDQVTVLPGERGRFCLGFELGVGLKVASADTFIEEIRPTSLKNSYWGPPTEGILAFQAHSGIYSDPVELARQTGPTVAVVPVEFSNQREEPQEVKRCLVPLRELNLYLTSEGNLVYEIVRLEQLNENEQIPRPVKRPPREFGGSLTRLAEAPNKSQTLLEKVGKFSGWDQLSGMFFDR